MWLCLQRNNSATFLNDLLNFEVILMRSFRTRQGHASNGTNERNSRDKDGLNIVSAYEDENPYPTTFGFVYWLGCPYIAILM